MSMMNKRRFIASGASLAALSVLTAGCTTTGGAAGDPAAQRKAIDSAADSALTRLYREAGGSQELIASSRGMLVFPNLVSAGFIVGGASGQGVLRQAGKSAGYYRMTEASVGLLAGAQSQAVFILFMTQDALTRFQASSGWTVGVDGSVALITVGADARITSQTAQQPIVGFVLTNSGLMGSLSLSGNRITPLGI
jgi:lipid-binding SYLF domain-containing protein